MNSYICQINVFDQLIYGSRYSFFVMLVPLTLGLIYLYELSII